MKTTAEKALGTTIGKPERVQYPLKDRPRSVMQKDDRGNDVLWKPQSGFHRALEISLRTRDSHIPTVDALGMGRNAEQERTATRFDNLCLGRR